jgi:hypothetical protein
MRRVTFFGLSDPDSNEPRTQQRETKISVFEWRVLRLIADMRYSTFGIIEAKEYRTEEGLITRPQEDCRRSEPVHFFITMYSPYPSITTLYYIDT